jgi:WD40 repeat protein/serine/threonine protein kinase
MANHPDRTGQQVGDYRLLCWLGGGGFGDVYLAEQVQNHSHVAVKLLHTRLSRSGELKAFINEARTIRLKHAHIVPLLDFDISREEIPFLVMEYAPRGTLRGRHPKGSQVPLPLVVDYVQQVGSALEYAHKQRLIHRDVKPGNMLLRADGTVLLSDFGLAAVVHGFPSLSPHQRTGGTVAYMAPEQIEGKAQAASDQYSLGVVVYEWITGRRPFEGTAAEVAMQHVMKPPPSLVALVPTLSKAVEEILLKALAKDPRDRFVAVQDFVAALERAVLGILDMSAGFISQQLPPSVVPDEYNPAPVDDRVSVLSLCPSTLPISSSGKSPKLTPWVDWGDALAVPIFYGREEEQALLAQWVVQERCRVVSILGMGGIGKSALVMSVARQLVVETVPTSVPSSHDRGSPFGSTCPFEVVIIRSLHNAPSCEALLDDCLQVLSSVGTCRGDPLRSPEGGGVIVGVRNDPDSPDQQPPHVPMGQRVRLLLEYLRKFRVLLVLDNLECLLEARDVTGHLRPCFEEYGQLLHLVAETGHQSCLLLTSREKPAELRPLGNRYPSVRSLRLGGLGIAACKQLLEEKGVVGTEEDVEQLIEVYAGNPLALKIVAETIVDLFRGAIGSFLAGNMVIFSSITDLLDEQFARLSALEQTVLYWLAIMREPVTLDELLVLLACPLPRAQMFQAIDSGYQRSLIECGKRPGSFTLQAVVMEYMTMVLIAEAISEIQQHRLNKLIQYSLEQAHAREYVRQAQQRLLVCQLLEELQGVYPGRTDGTPCGSTAVEEQLLSLLDELRGQTDHVQGYGPANLITLLRAQRKHLSGLDLSQLCIRGAYLQGIQMQGTSLVGSLVRDTVFTEAVSTTWAVAISPDGKWWATGGVQGKVCIWDGGRSQALQRAWRAHTDMVQALAFSPDGRTLASGSLDGTVKLWDVRNGALLWMDWQNGPQTLAFSPNGSLLACSGLGTTIRLWDVQGGTSLQSLEHPAHVFAVAWSPDGRLLASTCVDGQLRLWEQQETRPFPGTEILRLSTSWETRPVLNLAFAPDGRTLASTGWEDRQVKLWEVGIYDHEAGSHGRLLHTFEGETSKTNSVSWSPDGRTLVSCSYENALRLWDVEERRHRTKLYGHTSSVNSMAFTPDSSRLLSGSDDGTLRVWDVGSGHCVRVIQGYAISHYDLDWSPDSAHLLSCGTDGLVTIWDLSVETLPRELRGHTRLVCGVGWSPDGRFVASCGWDMVMRLWNPISLSCIQIFENASTVLMGMAWSPDGSLLAVATFLQGMHVWDVRESCLRWVGEQGRTMFFSVAWSPDGSLLAGGGDDGNVYLWESADGTLRERLPGHHGNVVSVAWSPDGTKLASGSSNRGSGELFVWHVQTCRVCMPVRTLAGHPGIVYAVAWSPGGDQLISGGSDGLLHWWDVKTGERVNMQVAHHGTVRSLRVSPDGSRLASCGDDDAIMIWDLISHEHMRTLQRDRPYEQLNITDLRDLNEAQKSSLQALGAIDETVL